MSIYNFELVRPYDRARSEGLQKIIARNIGPRTGTEIGPIRGRLRNARFDSGGRIPEPPPGPPPPPPPPPLLDPQRAPTGAMMDPFFVASGHYGGTVLGFNFLGSTVGGGGNNEIRVSPYLDFAHFETKAIRIVPYSGVSAGQFLQILKSPDDDIANSATPTGSITGVSLGRTGSYPAPDNERAIAIPVTEALIDTFRIGWTGGAYIKLRLYFVAPAIALPVISVLISVAYRVGATRGLFAIRA